MSGGIECGTPSLRLRELVEQHSRGAEVDVHALLEAAIFDARTIAHHVSLHLGIDIERLQAAWRRIARQERVPSRGLAEFSWPLDHESRLLESGSPFDATPFIHSGDLLAAACREHPPLLALLDTLDSKSINLTPVGVSSSTNRIAAPSHMSLARGRVPCVGCELHPAPEPAIFRLDYLQDGQVLVFANPLCARCAAHTDRTPVGLPEFEALRAREDFGTLWMQVLDNSELEAALHYCSPQTRAHVLSHMLPSARRMVEEDLGWYLNLRARATLQEVHAIQRWFLDAVDGKEPQTPPPEF